jgi:MATE family multidrug resistance protein
MLREARATLSLAWPVVVAEMGWVVMGIVDTIAVGPLGPAAIGAVSTGSTLFFSFMVFGIGTFYALDTFISQSYGARKMDDCHRWLFAGLQLAVVLSAVLIAVGWLLTAALDWVGIHPDVLPLLKAYLRVLLWSAPPLLFFAVLRRYLQAMSIVRPLMATVIVGNVVNAAANWTLIYGWFGLPALGALGSAYATILARCSLLAMLGVVVFMRERQAGAGIRHVPFKLDIPRMRQLLQLGLPAAGQIVLEVGVFAAVSALAGRMSPIALAANQIVLNIASFFFMVPSGLSSAAAVRVGQAIGRGDPVGARLAGWSAIALALVAASAVALTFVTVPLWLLRPFTAEMSVLTVGSTLLLLCALFQPFDTVQVVATGALRGLGETRIPMWANLIGHWAIGLPVAVLLCFTRGWGVAGLWTGLATGLALIGTTLLLVWTSRSAGIIQRSVGAGYRVST